jgi:hypothetical protein
MLLLLLTTLPTWSVLWCLPAAGPTLHAEVGDTLVVVLLNKLDWPINLIAGGVDMAGAAPAVNPNDTYTARCVAGRGRAQGRAAHLLHGCSARPHADLLYPTALCVCVCVLCADGMYRRLQGRQQTAHLRSCGCIAPPMKTSGIHRQGWLGRWLWQRRGCLALTANHEMWTEKYS